MLLSWFDDYSIRADALVNMDYFMAMTIEAHALARLRGQALEVPLPAGPGAAARVARRVCGLQAQDVFTASLGVRVRSAGATLGGVERARFTKHDVVWTWAMRGTLHLLAADDLDWLLPLFGPVFAAAGRTRRRQLGLDEDTCQRGIRALRKHLAAHGPCTREELGSALRAAGVPPGYSPARHLLFRAALEGLVCLGPDRGSKPTVVLLEDWLGGPLKPVARAKVLARLAERYLAAYGPAVPEDLAVWSGLPAPLVREAWELAAGKLAEVTADGRTAWLPRGRLAELDAPPAAAPRVRLLPAFDNYLLGYRDRDGIIEPRHRERVFAGGVIRGVILVDGRVIGVWKPNRKGRRVDVTLEPFDKLPPGIEAPIAAEVADIRRFVGSVAHDTAAH
jgi:hypothetical protein